MTTILVNRVYNKRETAKSDWEGRVGSVEFELSYSDATLNGTAIGETSMEYLMNFALQSMQDAYAGAASLDEAIGNFEKKRDAIIAGTIGTRSGSGGVSRFVEIARSMVKAAFKKKHGKKSEKWLEFVAKSDDDQDEFLDAAYDRNVATFKPEVEARILQLAAEKAAKKALAENAELDL